jgi:hypothetical protein
MLGLRILSDGRLEYLTTSGDGTRTVLTRVRRQPGGAISHSVRIPIGAGSFSPRFVAPAGAGYVVLGQMSTVAGAQSFLVKVTATGARDRTFGNNGVVALPTGVNFYDTVAVGTRGQVAVGLVTNGSTTTSSRVLMLRPNGSRDTAFGSNGVFSFPAVDDDVRIGRIRFMGDGRLYVLYTPDNNPGHLVRLTATGRRDTTYSGDGTADLPALSPLSLRDFALVGSGKVAVIGTRSVEPSRGPAPTSSPRTSPAARTGAWSWWDRHQAGAYGSREPMRTVWVTKCGSSPIRWVCGPHRMSPSTPRRSTSPPRQPPRAEHPSAPWRTPT